MDLKDEMPSKRYLTQKEIFKLHEMLEQTKLIRGGEGSTEQWLHLRVRVGTDKLE